VAHLGQGVSLEIEADVGPDQDGVNNINPSTDTPDQDGVWADDCLVNFPLNLPHCWPTTFDYWVNVVMPVDPLFVNVWFDWNRDGDWDDTMDCSGTAAPEWAVQNQLLGPLPLGLNRVTTPSFLPWHDPTHEDPNEIWMRITLTEAPYTDVGWFGYGGSGPMMGYQIGETEDYYFIPRKHPPCWNYATQCHGDAGSLAGPPNYGMPDNFVNTDDWPHFRDSFQKSYPNPAYDPCGDFTSLLTGPYAGRRDGKVDTDDWPEFRDNFQQVPPGGCTPDKWPP